jgi:hypothetical protein
MAGYEPVGVVGQIIPWNFPLLMLAWKIAPGDGQCRRDQTCSMDATLCGTVFRVSVARVGLQLNCQKWLSACVHRLCSLTSVWKLAYHRES